MNELDNNRLVAYLLGECTAAEQAAMSREIEASPALQKELQGLQLVLGLFDQQPEVEPSDFSRDQFYQFLEMESRSSQASASSAGFRRSWWAAAGIALLAIGLGFGVIWQNHSRQQEQISRLSAEIVETRKLLLLAMLEDPSASERIKAMNVSTRDYQYDQRVVSALVDRLQNDENENVRLKAAEALAGFIGMEGVAEAVILALEKESSPEVQIMLIESLVNGERTEAAPSLRRLLQREDVPPVVRDLAAYGLESII